MVLKQDPLSRSQYPHFCDEKGETMLKTSSTLKPSNSVILLAYDYFLIHGQCYTKK